MILKFILDRLKYVREQEQIAIKGLETCTIVNSLERKNQWDLIREFGYRKNELEQIVDHNFEKETNEYIICAAIWFDDGEEGYDHQPKNIDSGFVISGLRHCNCFTTVAMFKGLRKERINHKKEVQGFITNKHRFVNRVEAMEIAKNAGQVPSSQSFKELNSEDLY